MTPIQLQIWHAPAGTDFGRDDGKIFVLHTCQRSLYLSFYPSALNISSLVVEKFQAEEAYCFLLEVLCGLRSRIVAETEVAQQFKLAYNQYLKKPHRCPLLMRLIEKLFKDAKEVRTRHLNQVGQKSYASLARQILSSHTEMDSSVLVLGNGELAQHLLFHLQKHYQLVLCGRNEEKVQILAQRFKARSLAWEKRGQWREHAYIVNTIGAREILFSTEAFFSWEQEHTLSKAFVDLGFPSVIETDLGPEQGVYRLPDIFQLGEGAEEKKRHHLSAAQALVLELGRKRLPTLLPTPIVLRGEPQFA